MLCASLRAAAQALAFPPNAHKVKTELDAMLEAEDHDQDDVEELAKKAEVRPSVRLVCSLRCRSRSASVASCAAGACVRSCSIRETVVSAVS